MRDNHDDDSAAAHTHHQQCLDEDYIRHEIARTAELICNSTGRKYEQTLIENLLLSYAGLKAI